jgi:type I restriction enzyme M protein
VLIVDASKPVQNGPRSERAAARACRAHPWLGRDYTDVEGIARVVTLEEIAANDHNLNIPRYVEPKVQTEVLTVQEATQRLSKSAEAAFAAEGRLVALLKSEGLLT